MKLSVAEILKNADQLDSLQKRREYLLKNDVPAVRHILKCVYDPKIKFLLPPGKNVPYKPSEFQDQQGRLYTEIRKFYLFIDGGHNSLTKLKREQLFIDLLESIDPQDANMIVHVKDKKLPFKNITRALVERTFPGLIDQ